MRLEIVEVDAEGRCVARELDPGECAELLDGGRPERAPRAWIVDRKLLPALRERVGGLVDRGVKHELKGLAATLLRGRGIPTVDGNYSSAGKLRDGVSKLLAKAAGTPQRLFVVGTTPDILAEFREAASRGLPEAAGPAEPPGPAVRAQDFREDGGILSLLHRREVPEELRQRYLGESVEAEEVRQLVLRAAAIDATVLVTGDTGTGKEIVARQVHRYSRRFGRPFIAVNCGALPPRLFESELFGHEKGAFTDACQRKKGLWRAADGGTLFLDEIGDLLPDLQAKVLRALQEKRIRPVGSEEEIAVDARVVAATNRDLFAMVQAGQFREDLYYRLRCFLIHTPALREHAEDIPILARALWREVARGEGGPLPEAVVRSLGGYAWPGNVREMKMVLTHLHGLFGDRGPLSERHLRAVFAMQGQAPAGRPSGDRCPSPATERFAAFRHLKRTYEAVRAAEHLLAPLFDGGEGVAGADIEGRVRLLVDELGALCRPSWRFQPRTYDRLGLLRSRLSYFLGLLGREKGEASEFLRREGRRALDQALSSVLGEIDEALASL